MDYREADLETRLAIAQAQDTSLEMLQQLATDKTEEVRRAIALNPNADKALLRSLGAEFPEEVIQNPMFGLLLLENPEESFVRLSLARSTTASLDLLEECAQSTEEELLIAVAVNPNTPLHVLEQLVSQPPALSDHEYMEREDYRLIFKEIVHNPNVSAALLRTISEQWGIVESEVARNPKTPVDLLEKFSTWNNSTILLALCQNMATPQSIIEKLVIGSFQTVREAAKVHPNAPQNLEELQGFIEGHPKTSPELLEKLASDSRSDVRSRVAQNSNTPIAALERLALDDNPKVAVRARQNPNASETVLTNYAKFLVKQATLVSPSNKFRHEQEVVELTQHPKITAQALEVLTLFDGGSTTIYSAITKSKAASSELLLKLSQQTEEIHCWGNLVKNPATPGKALTHLFRCLSNAKHPNAMGFLSILAAHPNVPQDLWPAILQNPRLLTSAASNPNLPHEAIQAFISAEDWAIVGNIAQNPSTSPEILQQLMGENIRIRCQLAQNPNLPLALLETLAKDEALVRQAVAQNPAATFSMLSQLAQDEDDLVIFRLSYNPNSPSEVLERVVDKAIIEQPDTDTEFQKIQIKCLLNLASHTHANLKILRQLASCKTARVHYQMLQRPNLDEEIIQLIMDKTVAEMLAQNTMTSFTSSLSKVCMHQNTPTRILEDFANNRPESLWTAFGEVLFWSLRRDIAQNPKTPLSVLETLSQDNQPQIQKAAKLAIQQRS